MQKLLALTPKFLRTGEARSRHDEQGGAWESAIGLNPFIPDDAYRFLLATTAPAERIGDGTITDTPIAFARDPGSNTSGKIGYILGDDGRFYRKLTSGEIATIRPQSTLTAITNPRGGMAPVVDVNNNKYIFLARRDALVRWDLDDADDASHWNETNALHSCEHHPFRRLFDSTFFGNGYSLGRIPHDAALDDSGLANVEFDALRVGDFLEFITALGDDGRYLLIGVSRNVDESLNPVTDARILWYSGVGPNWEWEVTLKGERAVRAIVRNALGVFAIGEQTIYQLSFGQPPKLVRTFPSADSISSTFLSTGQRANAAAPFGDSMLFGMRAAAFGKRFPSEHITFSHPIHGMTGNVSMIVPDFEKNIVLLGTDDDKLWEIDMTEPGASENTYRTRWIPLAQLSSIAYAEIDLPEGLGEEDAMTLTLEVPSGQTYPITLTQAAVNEDQRTLACIALDQALKGLKVRLSLTQSAGAPRMGGITLYGEPIKH